METKYNEIEKMWTRAHAVMFAPEGFREACEEYISETMGNVLMTRKLLTKANHLIGEVVAVWLTDNNKVRLDIKGWDSSPFLTELDEDNDVKQVADLVRGYEKFIGAADFKSDADERGNLFLVRKIGELSVKPLMGAEKAFRMEDGVLYVPQEEFYKGIDNYLMKAASEDFDNVKQIYERAKKEEDPSDDNSFRRVAKEYLKREIEEQTISDVLEFPCGDKLFEVWDTPEDIEEECAFVDARLDSVYKNENGNVYFAFSNGTEESIDEIDFEQLWTIVYTIEYRKVRDYEEMTEMAKHIKSDAPNDYAWMAKEFLWHTIYRRMHSSRWDMWYDELRLTIMNKNNEPIGLLHDIVCKNGNVKVELNKEGCFAYGNIKYDDMGGVVDFDELSPISMMHLVELVGGRMKSDGNSKILSNIHHFEKDGVRAPYRIWNGEKIGSVDATWDEDINAIYKANGIVKWTINYSLYYDEDGWIEHAPIYEAVKH